MKKILFSTLLLLLTFLCVSAQESDIITYTSGEWEYTDNKTGITLTSYAGKDTSLAIPEILDERPVTQLGKDLFKNNSALESVFIPDSVTSIGSNAFNGCAGLSEVRLPNGLTKIDNGTFRYCIRLQSVDIPFSVTEIGSNAFADCLNLKEAMLISATKIGDAAFDNCQKLDSVTISRKLTSVGGYAFRDTPWLDAQTDEFVMLGKGILVRYNGSNTAVDVPYGITMITDAFADNYFIESITIPDTVLQIGANAFRDAINLQDISLPPYLTAIGANAFDGCRSMENIELTEGIKSLGSSAFANCNNLAHFEIPEAVTSLPGSLLANCPKLTEVTIPASVTKIDNRAFQGSPNILFHVAYGSKAEGFLKDNELPYDYSIRENDGFLYAQDEEGIRILRYTGSLFEVEIPAQIDGNPVVGIENGAFQNNGRVRRVIIPMTVKTIGDWAFSYMQGLRSIRLSEGLESLGSNVFTGSANIQEIRFPKGITAVGEAPLDPDAQTMICVSEGTAAAEQLVAMGYTVNADDACTPDEEILGLWAELTALEESINDSCDCNIPQKPEKAAYEIFRITDGISFLNADLLTGSAENLVLIIPESVTQIDADILENHNVLTIVSATGTAAEQFAKEQGIKFLVRFIYSLNM